MAETPAPDISLKQVTKRFGEMVAVDAISLDIPQGDFFAMLGPSGGGKTTTLRMIGGFEGPTEGTIELAGREVTHAPPYRRDVNTVFQSYALFPHLSIERNVAFGLQRKKVPKAELRQRVAEALELVELQGYGSRKPAQLSGGQQQRVALARALILRPKVLLLDEPLAALDLKLRQTMQLELKRIQRETGVTFVFVTHDQQEALTMSDRIAVMSDGWVEQIGSPTDIYHHPATSFVAGFIGEANLLDGTLVEPGVEACTVAVAGSTLRVPGAAPDVERVPGSPVLVMVRPERVRVEAAEPSGATAGVAATIAEVIFRGPVVHVALRTAADTPMTAHLTQGAELADLRPGDRAWACWDFDAAYLVPPAAGPPAAGQGGGRGSPRGEGEDTPTTT